jgi:hypothetical protein
MNESDPAGTNHDGHRFRVTLARVLLVQVIALLLLGWMQHHFSH